MEQSKALSRLLDAADLLAMIEDLTSGQNAGRLSPSVMSGLRLTIRNAREVILGSHDTLAASLVSKSRSASETLKESEPEVSKRNEPSPQTPVTLSPRSQIDSSQMIKRNDLRASLERIIER